MSRPITNLASLARDVAISADLVGVKYDPTQTNRVLETFTEGFSSAAIEFRTTTKPQAKRGLSYRYVELDREHDPYAIAREAKLIVQGDRPVERLIPELQQAFQIEGYGVDAEASRGLEKIWPFLAFGYPLRRATELENMPRALASHVGYCESHGLTHFSIVSADYQHETANVYFMVRQPDTYTPAAIRRMITDLGFKAPSDEVLAYNARAVAINLTFAYASSDVERLCFYVPAPTASDVPVGASDVLRVVTQSFPFAAAQHSFIVGHTYSKSMDYIKLESDYTGTTLGCLQRCVGVPLAS